MPPACEDRMQKNENAVIPQKPRTSPAESSVDRSDVRGREGRTASVGGPRLLSAQNAAKYLGVPYTTLRDWALRGHVPLVRAPQSRRMWFDRRDLDRIIEQWKERLA